MTSVIDDFPFVTRMERSVLLGPCSCRGCGRLVVWLGHVTGWVNFVDPSPVGRLILGQGHRCSRRVE